MRVKKIKIDKGIPLPPLTRKYPFQTMKVGDSFPVPSDSVASVKSAAIQYANRCGGKMQFSVRWSIKEFRHRCWRIK